MIFLTVFSGLLLLVPLCAAISSRIAADLLPTYRRNIRPGAKDNVTDVVRIGLSINTLAETNNPPNSMIANGTMQLVWTDSRLAWNVTKYGTNRIQMPVKSIWSPKITGDVMYVYVYQDTDKVQARLKDFVKCNLNFMTLDMEKQFPQNPTVEIESTGLVHWNSPMFLNFRDRSPEKNHTLEGRFTLYVSEYKGVDVDIQPLTGSIDSSALAVDGEYYMHPTSSLTPKILHFDCCPGDFPRITVHLVVIKKMAYYTFLSSQV